MKKRIKIGLAVVVATTLVACSLLLFLPSARSTRQDKVLNELPKKYRTIDPAVLRPVLQGNFVTVANNFKPIQPDETALVYIWAPSQGSSSDSYRIISGISYPTQVGFRRISYKKEILIAPDPKAVGWTLLGKVHLAYYLQHKETNYLFGDTGELAANPKIGMAMLQRKWDQTPKAIQVRVERMLAENREAFKRFPKEGLILQTGLRKFYDIGTKNEELVLEIVENNLPSLPPAN